MNRVTFGVLGRLTTIVVTLVLVVGMPAAGLAETLQLMDSGRASVTFPRGTPEPSGRKDTVMSVKDGNEAFLGSSMDEPSNPELRSMVRNCPKFVAENAGGKVTARCWEIDGDPVKEVTTASTNGDLVIVRLIAHADRFYQAMYTRRGGSGPIGADGERFIASLHVNH